MPYFDKSVMKSPGYKLSETFYNSYMCQSQKDYLSQNCEKIKGIVKGNNIWIRPYTKQSEYRSSQSHILNFRNILSETISNITKDNPLKKGESVELTVEIELMKSPKRMPTNSLVEVTIIQHNKVGDSEEIKKPIIKKRMQLQLNKDNQLTCESSAPKHRKPFQGEGKTILTREGSLTHLRKDKKSKRDNHKKKDTLALTYCQNTNLNQSKNTSPQNTNQRKKFIKILPEDKIHFENNIDNGRTSKNVKSVNETTDDNKQPAISETLTKNNSLIKKISNVFLPSKKADKNEVVKSALSALKNEIDHLKVSTESSSINKSNKKLRKPPVHNLGKLVNNILHEVLDSSDDSGKNKLNNDSIPLSYQSFFEPITRKHKRFNKQINKKNVKNTKTKLYRSHSDTCCIRPRLNSSECKLKASNSISDCKPYTNKKPQKDHDGGDTNQAMSKVRHRNSYKNYKDLDNKNPEGDGKGISKHKIKSRTQRHFKRKNLLNANSSFINWNGKFIKVNKDIKDRIEMMIVNELENLAIKDGMECEVTPLPSMDNVSEDLKSVEKISSFICELDISDKSIKKIIKNRKSLHKKVNIHQPENHNTYGNTKHYEVEKQNGITSNGTHTTNEIQTATSSEKRSEILEKSDSSLDLRENIAVQNNDNKNPPLKRNRSYIFSDTNEIGKNDVQIKYINTNMNWSNDSHTVVLDSPEMSILKQINVNQRHMQQIETEDNYHFQKSVTSGFVKVIKSDDSTWNKYFSGINTENSSQPFSNQYLTLSGGTSTALKLSSESTQSGESTIQIELDIKDLEFIIKEARQYNNANKILIEAKKVSEKHSKRTNKFTGKNSPSYTNQLLINAAKKLEKYAKRNERNVGIKRKRNKS